MAQEYILMNGVQITQPDEGLGYSFETVFTEDSKRAQSGKLHASAMYTVESLSFNVSFLTFAQAQQILQIVARGENFALRYPSLYYGEWRDAEFYVKNGSLKIGRVNAGQESVDGLSFQMIGVTPID